MSILYICYEDMTGSNGAIRHVTEIVRGLAVSGYSIHLSVPRLRRGKLSLQDTENVTIHQIPVIPIPFVRPLSYLVLSRLIMPSLFRRLRPDIVYVRDIKFTTLPVRAAMKYGVPVIVEVNGLMDETTGIRGSSIRVANTLDSYRQFSMTHADHIVTVTTGIRDEIATRYGIEEDRISIIPNGVDLDTFHPIPVNDAKKKTGLSQAHKHVGFVGGLFPWHGVDQLITAAPLVLERLPNTRFVIVGSGMMESELKSLVSASGLDNSFVFTGSVPFSAVPDYINSFDICTVFFKKVRKDPGDPIKLYEYMACGRPIVASNVHGYGDTVEATGVGISVDSESPHAVRDAMLQILGDRGKAETMSMNGVRNSKEHHSWERRTEETNQVITKLLDIDP